MTFRGERFVGESSELKNVSNELVEAIRQKDFATFALLKARKDIDLNALSSEGITPLMATVIEDSRAEFSLLWADGRIDFSVQDSNGHTALWYAINMKRNAKKILLMSKT